MTHMGFLRLSSSTSSTQEVRRCLTSVASNWDPPAPVGWEVLDQVGTGTRHVLERLGTSSAMF